MKVYAVIYYDYDDKRILKTFKDELEAVIYSEMEDSNYDDKLYIEELEVEEGQYNVSDYNFFTYYNVIYSPFRKVPIEDIQKYTGVVEITKKKFINSTSDIQLQGYGLEVFIKADSEEDAKNKFYDLYEAAMNNHYKENNMTRQNGKIKTWKRPKE